MKRTFAMILAIAAVPASACVIAPQPAGRRDAPVRNGPDCRFTKAGQTHYGYLSRQAPLDLKNGRVGQRWQHDHATEVAGYVASLSPRNRFDPFCGSRMVYPGRLGAKG